MTTDSHPNPIPNRWHDQDVQGRSDSNVTREFWGDGADWASQPTDTTESAEGGRHVSRGDRCNCRTVVELHDLRPERRHADTYPGDFSGITR